MSEYTAGEIIRALEEWPALLEAAVAATLRAGTDWALAERLCATRADVWRALRWLHGFNPHAAALVLESYHARRAGEADDARDARLARRYGWRPATVRRFRGEAIALLVGYLNAGEAG